MAVTEQNTSSQFLLTPINATSQLSSNIGIYNPDINMAAVVVLEYQRNDGTPIRVPETITIPPIGTVLKNAVSDNPSTPFTNGKLKIDSTYGLKLAAVLMNPSTNPTPTPTPAPGRPCGNPLLITTNSERQENPDINGNIIVWEDFRNHNFDIYSYHLSTNQEKQITTNSENQLSASIYGNMIVWADYRHGNPEIYQYDLTTNQETRITNDWYDQYHPQVFGDTVVWEDNPTGFPQIIVYNLSTKSKTQLTSGATGYQTVDPAIDGNIVVWNDQRPQNAFWEVYSYDLLLKQELRVSRGAVLNVGNWSPDISGNLVVYYSNRSGNDDIYTYDLTSQSESRITTNNQSQSGPSINGNIIVWMDSRNGNSDIYGYNLTTRTESPLVVHPANQTSPMISGNTLVWEDDRNGNSDIYTCDISR